MNYCSISSAMQSEIFLMKNGHVDRQSVSEIDGKSLLRHVNSSTVLEIKCMRRWYRNESGLYRVMILYKPVTQETTSKQHAHKYKGSGLGLAIVP